MQQLDAMPHRPELKYTPTEKRILNLLSDGEAHLIKDMISCLEDELSDSKTVTVHITNIRSKLPRDEWIVCEVKHRKTYYRHIIKYNQQSNGKPLP